MVVGVLGLLVYVVAAATVLPQLIVSMSAGKADANTQLNAITNTRGALLGILTPLIVGLGGIAAFLTYRETTHHNRQTYEMARREREEGRRLRRADVYGELLKACHDCLFAAGDVYYSEREDPDYIQRGNVLMEKRAAMDLATDRVTLLGSNDVHPAAAELGLYCGRQNSL